MMPRDGGFDLRAHGAVADEEQLEGSLARGEEGGGFDQGKLPFLFGETADADQFWLWRW